MALSQCTGSWCDHAAHAAAPCAAPMRCTWLGTMALPQYAGTVVTLLLGWAQWGNDSMQADGETLLLA
eukprot:scaffold174043_cov24-Tisochrysis_lutea.AAC.1